MSVHNPLHFDPLIQVGIQLYEALPLARCVHVQVQVHMRKGCTWDRQPIGCPIPQVVLTGVISKK